MTYRRFRSLISLLLLLAYVSTGTALVPGALTLMAALDGSHELKVELNDNGAHLILHHRKGDFTPRVSDHQSPLARVLVTICAKDAQGDHCLSAVELNGQIVSSSKSFSADTDAKTCCNQQDGCDSRSTELRLWRVIAERSITRPISAEHLTKSSDVFLRTVRLLI